jgi:hypothetical protein
MSKNLQRKKPGYTKDGRVKIVSLNGRQLTDLLKTTSKKKEKAKIERRIRDIGYVAPVVETTANEETV